MKKIRILYIIDHLKGGGGEQQFVNIVNNIHADKIIYLTEDKGIRSGEVNKSIPVYGGFGKRRPLRSFIDIKKMVESFNPDIVHAFLMYSCFVSTVGLRLSRQHPVFVVQEFTSPGNILKDVKLPGIKRCLLQYAYRHASAIVTVSRVERNNFLSEGFVNNERKMKCIPDGIELDKMKSLGPKDVLRDELGLSHDQLYVTFAGSLDHNKGVINLVKAFARLPSRGMHLLILGDGPESNALKAEAVSDPRIEFLGYRTDAVKYIKASDLLVLPSYCEGLPNVIIEAMSVGTPVIASDVSGIPELIEDRANGLLVPAGDIDKLSEAIQELVDNRELGRRFSEESLKRVSYFDVRRMANDHERLYETLLTSR